MLGKGGWERAVLLRSFGLSAEASAKAGASQDGALYSSPFFLISQNKVPNPAKLEERSRTEPPLADRHVSFGPFPVRGNEGSQTQTVSTVAPVVPLPSSARCASAASASLKRWFTLIFTTPLATTSNSAPALSSSSAREAV
jgi:hypothetical protein